MLDALMTHPATAALMADGAVLADGGKGSVGILGLTPFVAGPAVAILVYLMIYQYYRNTKKTHDFENETSVTAGNLQAFDSYQGERTGLRESEIRHGNEDNHRQRVRRFDMQ